MNELLLNLAEWLAAQTWSIGLHEAYYMYGWVEGTHVLTLMLFLGMLCVIDLRMLGLIFTDVPAAKIAERLDTPMMVGFCIMVITGFALYYAIPVRTTQSIWFRIKVVLLIAAGINALLFRNKMKKSDSSWGKDSTPPQGIRVGAGISLALWASVATAGRLMAYDWYDCNKSMPELMYWAAGCVVELAAYETH